MSVTAEAVTFAEAAVTGLEAVEDARGILDRAKDAPWPYKDYEARKAIHDAIWRLTESLRAYWNLSHGIIQPLDEFPGLEPGPRAFAEALALVAEDVSADAGEVVRVIGEHCGSEAADVVRGSKGEQSWPTR